MRIETLNPFRVGNGEFEFDFPRRILHCMLLRTTCSGPVIIKDLDSGEEYRADCPFPNFVALRRFSVSGLVAGEFVQLTYAILH